MELILNKWLRSDYNYKQLIIQSIEQNILNVNEIKRVLNLHTTNSFTVDTEACIRGIKSVKTLIEAAYTIFDDKKSNPYFAIMCEGYFDKSEMQYILTFSLIKAHNDTKMEYISELTFSNSKPAKPLFKTENIDIWVNVKVLKNESNN